MNKKVMLIASLCLLAPAHAYSADGESMRSSGWYGGISTGVANIGGSVLTTSNQNIDIDTSDTPLMLKAGYVTESENRVEVYYKNDSIGIKDGDGDDIEASSFGVNYQWGFSSLSSERMIPYIRVGGGLGSAEIDGVGDDLTFAEFDVGAGVHYDMTDNLGLSAGIYRRGVAVSDDYNDSLGVALNGAELGINYYTY